MTTLGIIFLIIAAIAGFWLFITLWNVDPCPPAVFLGFVLFIVIVALPIPFPTSRYIDTPLTPDQYMVDASPYRALIFVKADSGHIVHTIDTRDAETLAAIHSGAFDIVRRNRLNIYGQTPAFLCDYVIVKR